MAADAKILLTAEDRTRAAFASVEKSFAGLQASTAAIAGSLSALGGVAGVGALGLLAKNAISAMAALDDFAEATGVSVEQADRLYQIARISGTELGTLQGIVLQLNKALFLNDEKDSTAARALEAIGLSADELRRKSPDEALRAIAGRLREFEDGASKSALTLALFGKRAGEVAPLLNDIASAGEVVARVTAEQAAQAEKLTKEWNALALQAESVGIAIANRIVPAFNTLIDTISRYQAKSGGLGKGLANLAEDLIDPQSVLSLEKQIADKARELQRARDDGDAARERNLTGEIVQLNERLRLQKALVVETKKAADEAAKVGSRGAIDASKIVEREKKARGARTRDPEVDIWENRIRLAKEADAEYEQLQRNNQRRLDDFIDLIEDEEKAREKSNQELQKTVQHYEDMADPLAVYRRQLGEIDKLELEGALNAETASRARAAVSNELQDAAERLNGTLERQNDIGRELGLTFTSAFEDAIINGEKFRDVLQSIGKDIARIALRKTVTEPLGNAVAGLFNGSASIDGSGNGPNYGSIGSSLATNGITSAFGGTAGLVSAGASLFAGSSIGSFGAGFAGGLSSFGSLSATTASIGAAGTGTAAGFGYALGAIAPYLAAIVAVASLFMGESTPHAGATVFGSEGLTQTPKTLAEIDKLFGNPSGARSPYSGPGLFYESDFTKRFSSDVAEALDPLALNLAETFNKITRASGLGGGFRVGLGFSADDDDKSRGRFAILDAAGGVVEEFRKRFASDPSKGLEQFGLAAQQGLLAGLRELDLGAKVNAVLDKSLSDSGDALYKLTQDQTTALLSLMEGGLLDDLVENLDLAKVGWDDINNRIEQFAKIIDLKPLFDRVGVSITEFGVDLVKSLGGIDNAAAVLQNAIGLQEIAAGSANSFADAIRNIRYGVLDDPGKYEFLDKEAQKQRDVLASLSDVGLIQDYSERLKETIVAAFGLLSPEEQAARNEDFVRKLEEAATLTQERLAAAGSPQAKLFEALPDKLSKAVVDGLKPFADAIIEAAREGRNIDLRLLVPQGVEVG